MVAKEIAAIRLMRLGHHGEAVAAIIVQHRHQDRMVGRMGTAVIGRIVQERIAALQDGVKLLHRCGHQIGPAQNVNRQAFGGGEQMVVGGDDAA